MIIIFIPWTTRNYLVYGKTMPFGVAGSFNFWIGNYHGANGEQEPQPEHFSFLANHRMSELQDESIEQFKNFLITHPLEFIKLTLLRINKYFSAIRPMGFWFYNSGCSQFLFILSSALAFFVLFVFGLGGFIRALKSKNEMMYYLLVLTVLTPLIIFVTVIETRYRFQIYPPLAILAAYFIDILKENKKCFIDKVLWSSLLIVSLNSIVDLILSIEKFKERLGGFF